jgi:hypothetical protein
MALPWISEPKVTNEVTTGDIDYLGNPACKYDIFYGSITTPSSAPKHIARAYKIGFDGTRNMYVIGSYDTAELAMTACEDDYATNGPNWPAPPSPEPQ